MILVMGATGNIGRHLVDNLRAEGHSYKALVRDAKKGRQLLGPQTPLAVGNYRNEESIRAALKNTEKLFLVTDQISDQWQVHKNIIDWAKQCGVQHIVKISAGKSLTREDSQSAVCRAHWQADQYLVASGLDYTLIHPQAFMDSLIESTAKQIQNGRLITPFKDKKFSFVAAEDIAKIAFAALINPNCINNRYIASGPEVLSWPQLAQLLSAHLKHPIKCIQAPLWLVRILVKLTVKPKWLGIHKAQMLTELSQPEHGDSVSGDQYKISGTTPMTFDQFLKKNLDHKQIQNGDTFKRTD